MQYRIVAVALTSLLFAAPASAWDNPPSDAQAVKAPQERLYCIQFDNETGSRISRTICKTKKEWERAGVDVDNPDAP